jgi:glycerophosphoryl diester phosphodiesterase
VGYFDGVLPRVIAHRGLALGHAENTLGAFGAAVAAGAHLLETDIHVSKDGHAIVAHDPNLDRVAKRPGLVSDYTAKELASIDLGHGEGFPTLVELLEKFPEAKFNIDLKTPQVVNPFVDVIRNLRASDRVLVASFDEATRSQATSLLPDAVSSATTSVIINGRLRSWMGLSASGWVIPPEVKALQVPPTYWGMSLVTPSFLRMAHSRDLEVHVWTINDPADMTRLLDMGVDGIVTDRADVAVGIISERSPSQAQDLSR